MPGVQDWIQRRVEKFARAKKPNAVGVLAEGDSWFTHGGRLGGDWTLIERLNRYRTLNIVSIANPGAELKNLTEPRNRRQWTLACNPDWLDGKHYDLVMLSAGGNDIVGDELEGLLHDKRPSRSNEQLVNKAALGRTLAAMRASLLSIRGTIDRLIGPRTPVVMHGYDYALPSGRPFEILGGLVSLGPWIKPAMVAKGIVEDAEQIAIVNFLIDEYNEFLIDRQADINHFFHMDFRGTLNASEWDDELHPTAAGRDKLAMKLRRKLVEVGRRVPD